MHVIPSFLPSAFDLGMQRALQMPFAYQLQIFQLTLGSGLIRHKRSSAGTESFYLSLGDRVDTRTQPKYYSLPSEPVERLPSAPQQSMGRPHKFVSGQSPVCAP
jgi:hypothetical protein